MITLSDKDREEMIKHYMEKSEKALKDAILLLGTDSYDAAANRAYYSMFQSEKALLLTKGILGDSHKHVHRSISKEFVKTGQLPDDIYKKIDKVQSIRTIGDYSGTKSVTEQEAKEAISEAKNFLDITKELINA